MSGKREQREELLEVLEVLRSRQMPEVVQRTRRNVMETAQRMQEGRAQSRRRLGVVLLALVAFLMLATPAIWSFSEAAFSEDAMMDVALLTLTVFVILLSTMMGALLSRGRRRGVRE